MSEASAPPAPPPGPEAEFMAFLRQGQFRIQRSRSTGRHVFYPRVTLPGTGETDLEWVSPAGTGVVYAITVKREREGASNIAIVELDEGVRLMTRIEGVESLPIGARVRARIVEIDGAPAVVFDPVGDAPAGADAGAGTGAAPGAGAAPGGGVGRAGHAARSPAREG